MSVNKIFAQKGDPGKGAKNLLTVTIKVIKIIYYVISGADIVENTEKKVFN